MRIECRTMPAPSHTFVLRHGLTGDRYYLDGKVLNGGDILELCFSGGWVAGRYEWSPDRGPLFFCSIELAEGGVIEHVLEIPDGALLRRPAGALTP
jgi:hypothetical protein